MCSGGGRNVQFFCERYGVSLQDLLDLPSNKKLRVRPKGDNDIERTVDMIQELVMMRDGVMSFSDNVFSAADSRVMIDFYVVINVFLFLLFHVHVHCVLRVRFYI